MPKPEEYPKPGPSSDSFAEFFQKSPDAIFVEDSDGYVIDVNREACRLQEMTREELIGKHVLDLVPETEREQVQNSYPKLVDGEITTTEGLSYTKSGKKIPVELRVTPIEYHGKPAVLIHARNIEHRIKARKSIERGDSILRAVSYMTRAFLNSNAPHHEFPSVLENLGQAASVSRAYILRRDARIVEVDQSSETTISYIAEWTSTGFPTLLENPELIEHIYSIYKDAAPSQSQEAHVQINIANLEEPVRKKFARSLTKSFLIVPITFEEVVWGFIGFDDCVEPREWSEAETATLRSASDSIGSAIHRERTFLSLEEKEEQLIRAQKLEVVGKLAGGIAHDFNNLLTTILGCSNLAYEETADIQPANTYIHEVVQAAERAATLTAQLRLLSRKTPAKIEPVNVNHLISDMMQLLRRTIGEDIELITDVGEEDIFIKADRGNIEQVLMNLAINARDAMPYGGDLSIKLEHLEVDAIFCSSRHGITPGSYAKMKISDTGTGMSVAVAEQMFDPFFTTKAADSGTGLGMSTAYGIIQQHRGHIEVDTEPGEGTAITIYLPRMVRKPRSADSKESIPRKESPGGNETILVVEDDDTVRKLTVKLLTSLGYHVLTANDGNAGREVYMAKAKDIDLVFSDVVMPGMSGPEMIEALRLDYPDINAVYTSGFTEDKLAKHRSNLKEIPLLQKPYTKSSLAELIRSSLDKNRRQKINR